MTQPIAELRRNHAAGLMHCAGEYIKELCNKAPLDEIARDHFMEGLSNVIKRGSEFPLADQLNDMLAVIGSCYVLMNICSSGSDSQVEIMSDALQFAAYHALDQQSLELA
jgi:hypothetical protein